MPKNVKVAGVPDGGGGKKKWVRQSGKKGVPMSPQKKNMKPSLHADGHFCGTLVLYSVQFIKKTGQIQEYYGQPLFDKMKVDVDLREATGVSDVMYRRGVCGDRLPQSPGSGYYWQCLVAPMSGDEKWQVTALRKIQNAVVDEWNKMGEDTQAFIYPSHVDVGPSNSPTDELRLDESLVDSDVVAIMKSNYGINLNSELSEMAEDDELVGTYFKSVVRGRGVLLEYATRED